MVNDNTQESKQKGATHFPESLYLIEIELVIISGTPGGSRTPNLLIRSQALYPIELRVHNNLKFPS